jgi:hypothetical protein
MLTIQTYATASIFAPCILTSAFLIQPCVERIRNFCDSLEDGILFVGSWYAKEPFIENSRSDTLVFEINNKAESVQVLDITANYVTFFYKNSTGASGATVVERYRFLPSTTE